MTLVRNSSVSRLGPNRCFLPAMINLLLRPS
jgi:hypothetical protein